MFSTALKFMSFEKTKSLGILIGIFIAVFLIGQQLSTLGYLESLMSSLVRHSDPDRADLWVVTDQTRNANSLDPIDASLVRTLKSIKGVEETYPAVICPAMMKFSNGRFANVQLVGSEAPSLIMGPAPSLVVEGERASIVNPLSFTCELKDAKNFHHPVNLEMDIELNGKKARITALTRNLKGYSTSLLYSTVDNVREISGTSCNEVNAILIRTSDGTDADEICRTVNDNFPGVRAWTRDALADTTVDELLKKTSMGMSFVSLVLFAVISGFFIIGLTLYTSTFDRVRDYGTLKAIGADNGYVSRLVMTQAGLYGIAGYVLAVLLLFAMKFAVAESGMVMVITPSLLLFLLAITLFISIGSSMFAVRKLSGVEPASVFR